PLVRTLFLDLSNKFGEVPGGGYKAGKQRKATFAAFLFPGNSGIGSTNGFLPRSTTSATILFAGLTKFVIVRGKDYPDVPAQYVTKACSDPQNAEVRALS